MRVWTKNLTWCVVLLGIAVVFLVNYRHRSTQLPKNFVWLTTRLSTQWLQKRCFEARCIRQQSLTMEGLLDWDPEDQRLIPQLASKWEWTADKEVRFTLRKDAKWSDGSPVRATDFVAAWKEVLEHCTSIPESRRLFVMVNAREFCEGSRPFSAVGVKADSEHTLLIQLRRGNIVSVIPFSLPVSWPRHLGTFDKQNGRFRVEGRSSGHITLRPNPYYRRLGAPIRIELLVTDSPEQRILKFLSNEADYVDEIPSAFSGRVLHSAGALSVPIPEIIGLTFSLMDDSDESTDFRKAVRGATSQKELSELTQQAYLPTDRFWLNLNPSEDPLYQPQTASETFKQLPFKLALAWQLDSDVPRANDSLGAWLENISYQWNRNLDVLVYLPWKEKEKEPRSTYTVPFRISNRIEDIGQSISQLETLYHRFSRGALPIRWGRITTEIMESRSSDRLGELLREFELEFVNRKAFFYPISQKSAFCLLQSSWKNSIHFRDGGLDILKMVVN